MTYIFFVGLTFKKKFIQRKKQLLKSFLHDPKHIFFVLFVRKKKIIGEIL